MSDPLAPFASRLALTWPGDTTYEADGSLGFFDVSGFTKLSERLAKLGSVGAETITEICDRIFGGLIAAAAGTGGDVLQFSGDAILVHWFGDHDDAERACLGALAMQRFIRDAGGIDTDAGRVRLRMSAGLHSGPLQFLRLGTAQHVILATGEGATATTAMEKAANATEVLVSPTVAARTSASLIGAARDGGHLLRSTRRPLPATDPPLLDAPADIHLPVPLREALTAGVDGEHRQVTLAFVGVRGVDDHIARHGLAATATHAAHLAATLEQIQHDYGVVWLGCDALPGGFDCFLATGVPTTAEDDDDRMLLGLRALQQADLAFPIGIGVNRGRNFVGVIGHPNRRTYSVTGDATNLAARLMARADDGTILASIPLLERARLPVVADPIEPFKAKGKAAPVRAATVERVGARRDADTYDAIPFVGRTGELAAIAAAVAGPPAAVAIVAEPGMGKSRLLHEALRALPPGTRIIRVGAEPYSQYRPYFVARPVVRALLAIPDDAPPADAARLATAAVARLVPDRLTQLPLLAPVIDADLAPTPETAQLDDRFRADATLRLVGAILAATASRDHPNVLAAEDLHWFDEASLALIEALAAEPNGWHLVATARPEFAGLPESVVRVDLTALPRERARRVALDASPHRPLSDAELSQVLDRAEGNPLFVRELALAIDAGGDVPDSLERLAAAKIDRLDPPLRRFLRECSVLGTRIETPLIEPLVGVPLDGRRRAALRELVEPLDDTTVRFVHDTYRVAAYAGLSHRRRRALHARAVDVLTTAAGAERSAVIALHAVRARRWDAAYTWSRAAGEEAERAVAFGEAMEHYQNALDAGRRAERPGPDIADIAERAGHAAFMAGRDDLAHVAFATVARCAPHTAQRARAWRRRGDLYERASSYRLALRWLGRALNALADDPEPDARREHSEALSSAAATRYFLGQLTKSETLARRAFEIGDTLDDDSLRGQAALLLDYLIRRRDPYADSPYAEIGASAFARAGNPSGVANTTNAAGMSSYLRGHIVEALDHYRRAEVAFREAGHVVGAALAQNNQAEVLVDQGLYVEAERLIDEAERQFAAARYGDGAPLIASARARIRMRTGDPQGAVPLLAAAAAEFAGSEAAELVLDTDLRRAECALWRGDTHEAAAILAGLADAAVDPDYAVPYGLTWQRLHALALHAAGRDADARAAARAAVAAAAAAGHIAEHLGAAVTAEAVGEPVSANIPALVAAAGAVGPPPIPSP